MYMNWRMTATKYTRRLFSTMKRNDVVTTRKKQSNREQNNTLHSNSAGLRMCYSDASIFLFISFGRTYGQQQHRSGRRRGSGSHCLVSRCQFFGVHISIRIHAYDFRFSFQSDFGSGILIARTHTHGRRSGRLFTMRMRCILDARCEREAPLLRCVRCATAMNTTTQRRGKCP